MKKEFYRRNLPHYQPLGGTFFVTFNLVEAIPLKVLKEWNKEFKIQKKSIELFSSNPAEDLDKLSKQDFAKRDKYLDAAQNGENWLKKDEIAQIVSDSIHFWDKRIIDLFCFCIMSNHVHLVFRILDINEVDSPKYLDEIMHSIKLFSAKKCNVVLGKTGQFWQHESYDRLIRNDDEMIRILIYVLNNPVKAGLVKSHEEWKWTYLAERFKSVI
ncbi:hypothetical protein EGI22_00875 [Lacihabitans sp. LS3-19]|uniref:transposase n=1 Tax=Lacihabitans sp. LS3-19 TaxID=2487335 RepID=UPI0020CCA6CB|nr:transposase [Lacihabitans sp. LS3-19]MCP9766439.1 hypothetical protein [Lacihabitans sp. LS3-19]